MYTPPNWRSGALGLEYNERGLRGPREAGRGIGAPGLNKEVG